MKFSEIDLPAPVGELISGMGYKETYPPQEMAIKAGVLEDRNLVLASPTASGKTLIAFMAAAKHIYHGRGKVIYLVPLKALASEKYGEFKVLEGLRKEDGGRIRVRVSTGDYDTPGEELKAADLIISTNERMDSLLRHRPIWLKDISLIIADEIHYIHSFDRGPTLEVLLTRLLQELPETQFLALSATISNTDEFSRWLGAEVISTDWRPVPLREGVFMKDTIFFNDGDSRKVPKVSGYPQIDMALETVNTGGQGIIFTRTRREAVGTAKRAASILSRGDFKGFDEGSLAALSQRILTVGEKTKLSETLAEVVRWGVAFHHAGLINPHRRLIEEGFRKGLIKILTATPTLAAGVNLPSRRVIITYYERYSMGFREPISIFEYKQMCGRAGRPQYDEYGEAILIAREEALFDILYNLYVKGEPERITSKLGEEDVLDMHILGLIVSRRYQSHSDVLDFIDKTLYSIQESPKRILRGINRSLKSLVKGELLTQDKGYYRATSFGVRVAQLYISPSTGILLKDYLEGMEDGAHPIGYLHLISSTKDMPLFPLYRREAKELEIYLEENEDLLLVKPPSKTLYYGYGLREYLQQLKTAMTLYDWIEELSEDAILNKWRVEPGDLHSVAYTAEWLVYSASQLAYLLGKKRAYRELEILTRRVRYGVKEELCDLVLLRDIGRIRARSLYGAGYRDLKTLAKASIEDLERIPGIGGSLARSIKEQLSKYRGEREPSSR